MFAEFKCGKVWERAEMGRLGLELGVSDVAWLGLEQKGKRRGEEGGDDGPPPLN